MHLHADLQKLEKIQAVSTEDHKKVLSLETQNVCKIGPHIANEVSQKPISKNFLMSFIRTKRPKIHLLVVNKLYMMNDEN